MGAHQGAGVREGGMKNLYKYGCLFLGVIWMIMSMIGAGTREQTDSIISNVFFAAYFIICALEKDK
jgi:hypothetical protein